MWGGAARFGSHSRRDCLLWWGRHRGGRLPTYLAGWQAEEGGTLAQLVFSFSHVSLACTPAHELVLPAFQVGLSSESLETRQRHIQSCVSLMPWAFLNSVQLTIKN